MMVLRRRMGRRVQEPEPRPKSQVYFGQEEQRSQAPVSQEPRITYTRCIREIMHLEHGPLRVLTEGSTPVIHSLSMYGGTKTVVRLATDDKPGCDA